MFLDLIDKFNLNQFVRGANQKGYNTLDLILPNMVQKPVFTGTQFFPIIIRFSILATSIRLMLIKNQVFQAHGRHSIRKLSIFI